MAEALFDDHPLQDYLRETEDEQKIMPGGNLEFTPEDVQLLSKAYFDWVPLLVLRLLELAQSFILSVTSMSGELMDARWIPTQWLAALHGYVAVFRPKPHRRFSERFKYDVISSSLLASSVTATPVAPTHSRRRSFSPDIVNLPGDLPSPPNNDATNLPLSFPTNRYAAWALLVLGLAALACRQRMLAATAMAAAVYLHHAPDHVAQRHLESETLESLDGLRAVGSMWDAVVNEAMSTLEREERSIFYGPSTPTSPSSSLRVALHSTLTTTHTQCDNVRSLLAALTAPHELAQMAEMYAPASPAIPTFGLAGPRDRTRSLPDIAAPASANANKRATWNGAYAAPPTVTALGSPLTRLRPRKSRRRSDLTTLLDMQRIGGAVSAPVTPVLPGVQEDDEDEQPPSVKDDDADDAEDTFGAAALNLRRKRRTRGMGTLRLTERRAAPSIRAPQPIPLTSPSRLTPLRRRNALSLAALHSALQGALQARRFAAAHLLALRFDDGDSEDSYWEDVRSVVALLSGALEDAAGRLAEALDDAEHARMRESVPSPLPSDGGMSPNAPSPPRVQFATRDSLSPPSISTHHPAHIITIASSQHSTTPLTQLARTASASFAPMPSGLVRFAAHVDAIGSALDDARTQLAACIAALHDPTAPTEVSPLYAHAPDSPTPADHGHSPEEPAALQAYDRLRRELGLALRECERGRAVLADALHPPPPALGDDEGADGVPALAHDGGNGSSGESDDRHDMSPATPGIQPLVLAVEPGEDAVDDASAHLLRGASARALPPPGEEQVFAADPETGEGGPLYTRARAKLPREERIRMMKARRASGVHSPALGLVLSGVDECGDGALPNDVGRRDAGWGPGGEVVKELKDVIWKVGERRRRLAERPTMPEAILSPLSPGSDVHSLATL